MKKTLIITLEFPPHVGGIATYVHDLASTFDPEKTVVLAPKMQDMKEWDEKQSYKIIRKNPLFPKFIWPRWIRLVWQVWRIVKKEKIELIMVHHVLPVGYAASIASKITKVPFLLFSHGTDLLAASKSSWKKKRIAGVSKHATKIIFNSESLKHRYIQLFPQFESSTLVMYPCPEKTFLEPPDNVVLEDLRNTYALHGKQVMLTVSRFDEGKGFPHLLRMMPKILEQVPHLVWMLIGDGPKKEYVLGEVQKNNLQNIVRYVGEVPHDELKKFYYLADLFVLLTHPDEGREEGLGLVFLEAAAAGLPVVAGKSGGVEEAVLHAETGILVDIYHGDPSVLENIVALLKNRDYADTLGKKAKERIRNEFVWEHQVTLLDTWLSDETSKK
ncbi:MAG: Glycosyltransferase, group 1 family protein [Candidatus Magasanikbacteria bacterium GW2011_GWD2_43_18]|uniref:Glycosyltransferase, group 1 family protein n=1 Tax=Candidatus Magasanikbacteria bacterium GW2011_GWE2_42_7 TaxID=1619052 RepID=A0A0G1BBW9_9BACT|nr:MAG: Glycosyltransferase, group 1 family protein [Candidatus Magasanikbacteria bacterium GW2011_GWC2_42_27]KKS70674.1 MAG: Glycosyltransferase, group 1 family protein [Candidatus Magasanikbacteria bacterium GW2011_GWE2_42_7]KKT03392.1 MAG: Glycosyltransferase, group 1 family protein [Candidatus Magasanikbacteria bacterium GW2011_GWD2_43_18]KKT25272.1 MAG: Glycosyltransferase, group 1 family protein [Candidatus Magasanikbacteria bacterium GW2011_GWA2_43_9]HBB38584.1 hypothetical protein [Cand